MKTYRQHRHDLHSHKSRKSVNHKKFRSNRLQLKDINILTYPEPMTKHEITHFDMDTPSKDPMVEFALWYTHAVDNKQNEPIAFSLATVNEHQCPSVRMILMRYFDHEGIVFFSSYESEKGQHLDLNPQASACFYWPNIDSQIRLTGLISKTSHPESDHYFQTRHRDKKIQALASQQSKPIKSHHAMTEQYQSVAKQYQGKPYLHRPDNWGGYFLKPNKFEFFQYDRSARKHIRIVYEQHKKNWHIKTLQP